MDRYRCLLLGMAKNFENWPLGSKVMTFQSLSHVHISATLKLNNFANVCRCELKIYCLKVLSGICKPARFHLDRLRCYWENWVWKWPNTTNSKFEKEILIFWSGGSFQSPWGGLIGTAKIIPIGLGTTEIWPVRVRRWSKIIFCWKVVARASRVLTLSPD